MLPYARHVMRSQYQNENSFKSSYATIKALINRYNIRSLEYFDQNINTICDDILGSPTALQTQSKQIYILSLLVKNKLEYNDTYKLLKKIKEKLNYQIMQNRLKNKPKNRKEMECLKIKYSDLKKFKINNNHINFKNMLFNLLVHQKETPRLDYRLLTYDPYDRTGNFVYEKNNDLYITLNDYKTAKTYGPWTFKLEPKVSEYMKLFIKELKLKRGVHIFRNSKGDPYNRGRFHDFISRTFEQKTRATMTIGCLRKIKELEMFHRNPKILTMTLKEKSNFVIKYFRHSLRTATESYNPILEEEKDKNKKSFLDKMSMNEKLVFGLL